MPDPASGLGKEAVCRSRQPQILAQSSALILPPEQAAALQLRYDAIDEGKGSSRKPIARAAGREHGAGCWP
jgi:hypothetical protein